MEEQKENAKAEGREVGGWGRREGGKAGGGGQEEERKKGKGRTEEQGGSRAKDASVLSIPCVYYSATIF